MTPEREEALKQAHDWLERHAAMYPNTEQDKCSVCILSRALIAAEAELQERDKPVTVWYWPGYCQCGYELMARNEKFCPECGRRLEWS